MAFVIYGSYYSFVWGLFDLKQHLKKTIEGQQLLRTVASKSLLTDWEAGLDVVVKWWSLPGPQSKFRPINSYYTPLFSYFFLLELWCVKPKKQSRIETTALRFSIVVQKTTSQKKAKRWTFFVAKSYEMPLLAIQTLKRESFLLPSSIPEAWF